MLESENLPVVTLVVAMRNEARYIGSTLESIFAQDYPFGLMEVLVVDSLSTDGSREIVEGFCAAHANCRLLDNPAGYTAAAWNVGIGAASGRILGIISGHCRLAPDYVAVGVETLVRTGAALVGGPMVAVGDSAVGGAVALATSSPFGVGDATFHYLTSESVVDTVFQGIAFVDLYDRVGLFDEDMHCNEDDELSFRIRANGGRIICNPAIRSEYSCRGSFRMLWRQYFRYGFWKVRLLRSRSAQMSVRHFVPALFVAALVAGPLGAVVWPTAGWLWLLAVGAYVAGAVGAAASIAVRRKSQSLILVPVAFAVMHMAYGVGFWGGLLRELSSRVGLSRRGKRL